MKQPKKDADLTLAEAEALLSSFYGRLTAIKAESIALRQQRPTRAEIAENLNSWLDRVVSQGGETLFSRLDNAGFLGEADSATAPGILFSQSPVAYSNQEVTAAGLIPFIAPAIRVFLESWLAAIPDAELGQVPGAERESRLIELESERQNILARRSALQSTIRKVESAGKIPAQVAKDMVIGGTLTAPDVGERLENKFFAAV